MKRRSRIRIAVVGLFLLLLPAGGASAQQLAQGTRTFVPSLQAMGMGGAAVAYPTTQTALFYNPAHLTRMRAALSPITMLGFSASLSSNFSSQLDFYRNRLEPAILDGIADLEVEEAQAFYDEVAEMGAVPTTLSADVFLPSFAVNRGRYGYGGGLFAHTEIHYFVEDPGVGVPGVDFTTVTDFMAVASGATRLTGLGLPRLSVGVTSKYVQRYLMLKAKPLDALDPDESLYMLGSSAVNLDVGLLYDAGIKALPGQLFLGAVWSDLSLKDFKYRFAAYYVRKEDVQDDRAIAEETALARERYQLRSSFRAGVAYLLPKTDGPFKETAIAADFVTYSHPYAEDTPLAHLALGVQTTLGNKLSLRTGLNGGYASLGAGVQFSFARIDYAFFGAEGGPVQGASASWNHQIQISLGSF